MKDLSSFILESLNFEEEVRNLFACNLKDKETIQPDVNFDFYLLNGFNKLKWPEKTAVEVKFRLNYTIYPLLQKAQKINVSYKNRYNRIVFVVKELNEETINNFKLLSGRGVEIISFDSLKEKLSCNPEITDNVNTKKHTKEDERENIKKRAANDLNSKRITLFLGAGVSASVGLPNWNTLIEQLCIKKNIDKIDSDIENIVKGRRIVLDYENKEDNLRQDIKQILYNSYQSTSPLLQSISRIIEEAEVESVITYNYDNLLELVTEKNTNKQCCPIYKNSRIPDKNIIPVYHVHGYIPKKEIDESIETDIILGEKEYHDIYVDSFNWGNIEQLHALTRNTCFFIGMSMSDPNVRRLLDISISGGDVDITDRPHYVFLRKIEYDVDFTETIMHSFGVNCIWYDQHEDLPKILEDLLIKIDKNH